MQEMRILVTSAEVLLYYYYGGMVYIGLKRMRRALEFLSLCVSAPADATSAIMVEALKKYHLVSLLVHGKSLPLPKYASHTVRSAANFVKPYEEFVVAYGGRSLTKLDEVLQKHGEAFVKDKNFGLVQQCRTKFTRKNIRQLTETFLTLSLEAIATQVELPDAHAAEILLVKMISDGEICATIDQMKGTVVFEDDAETFDSPETIALLQRHIEAAAALHEKVKGVDSDLRRNPKFIRKTQITTAADAMDAAGGAADMEF